MYFSVTSQKLYPSLRPSVVFGGVLYLCIVAASLPSGASPVGFDHEGQVTVADCVQMVQLGDPTTAFSPTIAHFSPDGTRFVVLARKGDLARNAVSYSLYLWNTTHLHRIHPKPLLTFISKSNRPAIQDVRWINESTIAFLAEQAQNQQQLYQFDLLTGHLKQLTHHLTSVVAYAVSADGNTIVFAATKPVEPSSDDVQEHGISVRSQLLSELIAGSQGGASEDHELFVKASGAPSFTKLTAPGLIELWPSLTLSLSPDGRYLIVPVDASQIPSSWFVYPHEYIQSGRRLAATSVHHFVFFYILYDLIARTNSPLTGTPIGINGSEVLWAPNSRSVAISDVYLPIDRTPTTETSDFRSKTYSIEVVLPMKTLKVISSDDLKLIHWEAEGEMLLAAKGRMSFLNGDSPPYIRFRRVHGTWVPSPSEHLTPETQSLEVIVDEDLNTPPKLFAVDTRRRTKILLLDPNPEFSRKQFGRVEAVEWKATDGHRVRGGLYLPTNYVAARRYPLVIQTHGFAPTKFWVGGPWPTAFAAQPLASKGFVVLQVEEGSEHDSTPQEAPSEMSSYEGAINYLDQRGLIDRTRVGLVGFSRTCLHVKYALTHSEEPFAAAVIADGIDAGYFQYMSVYNASPEIAGEFEEINGAAPFGNGLASWINNSPGFRLSKVAAPVLIQSLGRGSLLSEWEWFAGLSRLAKPVEMIYFPKATHILVRPREQLASEQLTVAWFCFWLKGEEDPTTNDGEYPYWRALKQSQQPEGRLTPSE